MKAVRLLSAICGIAFCMYAGLCQAGANTVDLYTHAILSGDVAELEKILAPNFWYIGGNGHIRDKDNFIKEIKDKTLVVDHLALKNLRETKVGDTRMLTANGTFQGKSAAPRPQGLMRYTMVLANNKGQEQVVLFQATPVISTEECQDGNCKIK